MSTSEDDLSQLEEQGLDNSTIQRLRASIEEANKRAAKAEKEAAAERTAREKREREAREANAQAIFEKSGLPPAQVKFFLAEHPEGEVTEEVIQTFAESYGLKPQAPEPEPPRPPQTFGAPVPVATTVPVGSAPPDLNEWKRFYARDPAGALAQIQELESQGRFPWPTDLTDITPTHVKR